VQIGIGGGRPLLGRSTRSEMGASRGSEVRHLKLETVMLSLW